MSDRPYDFGEGFQRKIIAMAVRSDLLVKAPGAFQSRFFGGRSKTPRQRLSQLVEDFGKEHKNERPGNDTMDELVRQAAARLKPAERGLLEEEWKAIRDTEVPDPGHVVSQVRNWAKDAAISAAVMQAADIVQKTRQTGRQEEFQNIKEMIDGAMKVGDPDAKNLVRYIADDHHEIWNLDPHRRKIATGFKRLDMMLMGGPQFGEVFYILAPPKGAKSAYLLNVALNASRKRHGVAFFSYEMRTTPIFMRLDRNLTQATRKELWKEPQRVKEALLGMRAAGAGEIWLQECVARKQGVEEAARTIERLRGRGFEIDLVVFDYLNIMAPQRQERERRHELPAISREMAELAKVLDVPVWSGALVNRKAVEKQRIKKTDIAEAFEVIAVADGMIAICSPNELVEIKQRRLYLAALREEEDERDVGLYHIDLDRMTFREIGPHEWKEPDHTYTLKKGEMKNE